MEIYKADTPGIVLAGQAFTADERGIISIPDAQQSGAFMQGFVSAKGRIRQLEAASNAAQAADAAALAVAKPEALGAATPDPTPLPAEKPAPLKSTKSTQETV